MGVAVGVGVGDPFGVVVEVGDALGVAVGVKVLLFFEISFCAT
jgi:hypothetical protein